MQSAAEKRRIFYTNQLHNINRIQAFLKDQIAINIYLYSAVRLSYNVSPHIEIFLGMYNNGYILHMILW